MVQVRLYKSTHLSFHFTTRNPYIYIRTKYREVCSDVFKIEVQFSKIEREIYVYAYFIITTKKDTADLMI